jgi:glycosyltransferase involved in cell wall biosynthesis
MSQLVSAVMIVKNGARTIASSLKSLEVFDEVVVFDNGSIDGTQDLVATFPNVRLYEGEFEGFGVTKNKAVSLASHNWILVIDADECIEPELAAVIHQQKLDPKIIYLLNFKAFYKDYQVKYCGWNNQKIRRVYNRTETQFTNNNVHENLIDKGLRISELKGGSVRHYSYHSISDLITKVERYSSLYAAGNGGVHSNRESMQAGPSKAFFSGIYAFFKTYILKRGFLDGYVGLLIAFSHMATNFYKYMKLYECNRDKAARRGHS